MRLCFLNNKVTEPWPQTKTEEILKSKSTLLKASCHLLLNQRVRITLFWKTSLVLIAFYVNISLQFTLFEHRYMAAVGFGWARLLLCLLMPCGLLLSSVITDIIPSFLITLHLVSGHYSFFSFTWATCISFVSVYQLFAELKQHNLLTFGLWHYKGWQGLTNDTAWKKKFLTIILEVPSLNFYIDLTDFFRQRLLANLATTKKHFLNWFFN